MISYNVVVTYEKGCLKGEIEMEEIKQFDIWTCDFGDNRALGEYGIRPCIVVSNNTCNTFSERVNVVPLTTASKKPMVTHCIITSSNVASTALCENITTVFTSQLGKKCGELNEFERLNITYCIKQQLGIK